MTSRTLSKEKIVAAAVELIKDQDNLTFTNLSRKLGTRSQAIYNYYSDVMAVKVAVAIDFYNNLAIRLQADLLGLSGKQAIMVFCNVSVQYALDKYLVAQQILSIPSGKIHDEELDNSALNVHGIMLKLLMPLNLDDKEQLVLARMLRNLILGEVVHVGNGRFDNKLITARDSFNQMLKMTLESY
ncbi:TetR/AcrR family transcriptional regulator [Companilactobacillus musae]|uniref:TetR/AcrR family transcriptional regulator n=1 Tax=Companilactobacillus musae TaxID=1903258 RepID=UPI000E64A2D9|nr:TetR/AcrR family transcriptional regulator [Companilactobacillus musae]